MLKNKLHVFCCPFYCTLVEVTLFASDLLFIWINFVEGDSSQHHNRDPDKMAEARVDIKKLATFLHGQQVNPSKVICSKYIIFFPPLNAVVTFTTRTSTL